MTRVLLIVAFVACRPLPSSIAEQPAPTGAMPPAPGDVPAPFAAATRTLTMSASPAQVLADGAEVSSLEVTVLASDSAPAPDVLIRLTLPGPAPSGPSGPSGSSGASGGSGTGAVIVVAEQRTGADGKVVFPQASLAVGTLTYTASIVGSAASADASVTFVQAPAALVFETAVQMHYASPATLGDVSLQVRDAANAAFTTQPITVTLTLGAGGGGTITQGGQAVSSVSAMTDNNGRVTFSGIGVSGAGPHVFLQATASRLYARTETFIMEGWQTAQGLDQGTVSMLAFRPGSHLHALASNGSGVFETTDGGSDWQDVSFGLPLDRAATVTSVAIGADGALYVGVVSAGVYRRAPGQAIFHPFNDAFMSLGTVLHLVIDDTTTPPTVYGSGNASSCYVFFTQNSAWQCVGGGSSGMQLALFDNGANPGILFGEIAGSIYRVAEGATGLTLLPSTGIAPPGTDGAFAVGASGNHALLFFGVGNNGYVYTFEDQASVSWTALTQPPPDNSLYSLVFDASVPRLWLRTYGNIVYTDTFAPGNTWVTAPPCPSPQQLALAIGQDGQSAGLVACQDAGVYSTGPTGTAQTRRGSGLDVANVRQVIAHRSDPTRVYALLQKQGLFRSTDSGASWAPVPGPTGPGVTSAYKAIALDDVHSPPRVYVAGSWAGNVSFYRYTDDGIGAWAVYGATGRSTNTSLGIAVDISGAENTIAVIEYNTFATRTESNDIWTQSSLSYSSNTDYRLLVDPLSKQRYYFGYDAIFQQAPAASGWTQVYSPQFGDPLQAAFDSVSNPAYIYCIVYSKAVVYDLNAQRWTTLMPSTPVIAVAAHDGVALFMTDDGRMLRATGTSATLMPGLAPVFSAALVDFSASTPAQIFLAPISRGLLFSHTGGQ